MKTFDEALLVRWLVRRLRESICESAGGNVCRPVIRPLWTMAFAGAGAVALAGLPARMRRVASCKALSPRESLGPDPDNDILVVT